MKKELRPVHDNIACDVCARTILKGEQTETYLAPGGQRHQVCSLCFPRAEHSGWIREAADGETPTRLPRAEPRGSMLGRLFRRRSSNGADATDPEYAVQELPEAVEPEPEYERPPEPAPPPRRSRPKDPRHVRAVPTTAEAKVDRALDLFNGSHHQRTIAGLARTLGPPLVSARPDPGQGSQVSIVVAWELSWYRYRVDLGDEGDPVGMLQKGEEIGEIDESLRDWNATLDADGRVLAGRAVTGGGAEG